MKKSIRYIIRTFIGIIILFILLWVILWAYIQFNKKDLIEKVKAQINNQIDGKIDIADIKVDLFNTFPNVSVRLSGVSIKDSLWSQHHHDFFKAEQVYVRLKLFSLFSDKPEMGKLIIENASLYLYTDVTGYTNFVKAKGQHINKSGIPNLLFKNTRFVIDDKEHYKLHDIEANMLECNIIQKDSFQLFKININSTVHGLAFNTAKGSYSKEKKLKGDFDILLFPNKEIHLNNAKLKIDKQPFLFNGIFYIGEQKPFFTLSIQTKDIDYIKITSILNQTIQQKLNIFNILQPIDITANLKGYTSYKSIPLVDINFSTPEVATIETPLGQFINCSLTGNFTNQFIPTQPCTDENSKISFKKFNGKWSNILLSADLIEISNLKNPFLSCDLRSAFELKDINELMGSNSLEFKKGSAEANITFKGLIKENDSISPKINGYIRFKDAEISYLPRNFSLKSCTGNLTLNNNDLLIETLKAQVGKTNINMDGVIKNLFTLINNPEKITLNWNISTPNLNLTDFISYIGKRSTVMQRSSAKSKFIQVSKKLDRMLEYGTANINIHADKISYKKFYASNLSGSVSLLQHGITLNRVHLNHAGGSLQLNGFLVDAGIGKSFKIHSKLNNVDIPGIFNAFNNFGQDAITDQNMKGRLNADVDFSGSITDKAVIITNSLNGIVNFNIKNAELNNFEPLQKISEAVFKKRDFTNVRFAELKDRLEINGSAIKFDKMEIASSVFTLFVEGIYDTKKGTDMIIQVPLRNLKKVNKDVALKNTGKVGANIRLNAKTADDGKLKISWKPF